MANSVMGKERQAYLIGGGLASFAAAVYLIRDGGFSGENIHILEGLRILGGSNDGGGNDQDGFICRGGRMLNEETYENLWELLSSIPSLESPDKTLFQEIIEFDANHPTHANARLVDKNGEVVDVTSMGFNNEDRMALMKLMTTPEEKLDNLRISDWFAKTPHFFETNFWYMWQTTFAFQKWSSLFEFRRYMNRMIFEFSRIQTLEGVTRTPYNQYESIILPIKKYLDNHGVDFSLQVTVTDLDFEEGDHITVSAIHYEKAGVPGEISLRDGDLCLMTNGSMTDNSTLGDYRTAPQMNAGPAMSGQLWSRIAQKKVGLGNPKPFFNNVEETNWESFTVTMKGDRLLKMIEAFSRNKPGSGALMTFKDSSWLMSIVVAAQPHFKNQPGGVTILWGYGLYTQALGDYVKKPMRECTGEEILEELLYHLHFQSETQAIKETIINVIPCMMPYIVSQFQPHAMSDRPKVVPEKSTNFALMSQYVEIPEDMVFTEEYSVRAARTAVYKLLKIGRKVEPVTPYRYDVRVLLKALNTMFR